MKKILQITDIHLSPDDDLANENWGRAVAQAHEGNYDLIVITGDIVKNGPDDIGYLEYAKWKINQLPGQWKCIPGDHDIGGAPPMPELRSSVPWLKDYAFTEDRLNHFKSLFDENYWFMDLGSWRLIGIYDSLFCSDSVQEAEQWCFLEEAIKVEDNRPIALFMHKPPCLYGLRDTSSSTKMIPPEALRKLRKMIANTSVKLIACGHLHESRTITSEGITIYCGPTIIRQKGDYPSKLGSGFNGLTEFELTTSGVAHRIIPLPYA